jgi:hypothetical protein
MNFKCGGILKRSTNLSGDDIFPSENAKCEKIIYVISTT